MNIFHRRFFYWLWMWLLCTSVWTTEARPFLQQLLGTGLGLANSFLSLPSALLGGGGGGGGGGFGGGGPGLNLGLNLGGLNLNGGGGGNRGAPPALNNLNNPALLQQLLQLYSQQSQTPSFANSLQGGFGQPPGIFNVIPVQGLATAPNGGAPTAGAPGATGTPGTSGAVPQAGTQTPMIITYTPRQQGLLNEATNFVGNVAGSSAELLNTGVGSLLNFFGSVFSGIFGGSSGPP